MALRFAPTPTSFADDTLIHSENNGSFELQTTSTASCSGRMSRYMNDMLRHWMCFSTRLDVQLVYDCPACSASHCFHSCLVLASPLPSAAALSFFVLPLLRQWSLPSSSHHQLEKYIFIEFCTQHVVWTQGRARFQASNCCTGAFNDIFNFLRRL